MYYNITTKCHDYTRICTVAEQLSDLCWPQGRFLCLAAGLRSVRTRLTCRRRPAMPWRPSTATTEARRPSSWCQSAPPSLRSGSLSGPSEEKMPPAGISRSLNSLFVPVQVTNVINFKLDVVLGRTSCLKTEKQEMNSCSLERKVSCCCDCFCCFLLQLLTASCYFSLLFARTLSCRCCCWLTQLTFLFSSSQQVKCHFVVTFDPRYDTHQLQSQKCTKLPKKKIWVLICFNVFHEKTTTTKCDVNKKKTSWKTWPEVVCSFIFHDKTFCCFCSVFFIESEKWREGFETPLQKIKDRMSTNGCFTLNWFK